MKTMEVTLSECQRSVICDKPVKILDVDLDVDMDVLGWSGKIIRMRHRVSVPLMEDAEKPPGDWNEIVIIDSEFKGNKGYYRRHMDS